MSRSKREPGVRTYGGLELRRRSASCGDDRPNVLFISLDDCNDWPGFLRNHPGTLTPNLDALAATSLSFTHAYCTAPLCRPARTSVLFGVRPHESGAYDHGVESTERHKALTRDTPSLIDDFWAAGYVVAGAGKVFHGGGQQRRWSEYRRTLNYLDVSRRHRLPADLDGRLDPTWRSPYDGTPVGRGERFDMHMIDFGPSGRDPVDDPDGQGAAWVCERLQARQDRPLFLGFGMTATHVPWRVSQRFFDLHPIDGVVLPDLPVDTAAIPSYARDHIIDTWGGFRHLRESGRWARAVQAYQASMTAMDHHLGVVLDCLAASPYADDTIVAVWSDHGFHLGEKLHLRKFALWEHATRVPLLLHVPGRFDHGQAVSPPVSTIDLGPTIAELCDVGIHGPHRGASLLPIVDDPEVAAARPPVTTWQEDNHAVRRGPWRYIRYRSGETELYDHRSDPLELANLAGSPDHVTVRSALDRFLPAPGEPAA